MSQGTRVVAIKDFTSNGIEVSTGDVGIIVSYPGRDDGQAESQPNVDLGIIRVAMDQPGNKVGVVCVDIDRMAQFFTTVPTNTAVTVPS